MLGLIDEQSIRKGRSFAVETPSKATKSELQIYRVFEFETITAASRHRSSPRSYLIVWHIAGMNLAGWAEFQGIARITAYRWFHDVKLPGQAFNRIQKGKRCPARGIHINDCYGSLCGSGAIATCSALISNQSDRSINRRFNAREKVALFKLGC